MRSRRLLVCALAAWATVVGCGSLDGLTGGESPSPDGGGDSGPIVVDGAPQEADGGADATADGDATVDGGFCALHASSTLCSDFDGTSPFAGWTRQVVADPSAMGVDTTLFLSAPRSLLSHMKSQGSAHPSARLELDIPLTATHTRVSFEMKMAPPTFGSSTDTISVGEFTCHTGDTLYDGAWLFWAQTATGPELRLYTNKGATYDSLGTLPSGFALIEIDALWGATSSVSVKFNGVVQTTTAMPTSCTTYASFFVGVGLSFAAATQGDFTANYDNIVYELDPQ